MDGSFHPYHLLYRRCNREDLDGNRLLPGRIKLDTSVNWSKYSEPWDVIFDYPASGFAQIRICFLPSNVPHEVPSGEQSALYVCRPSHAPCHDNYSHSEIWTYKKGKAGLERIRKERVGNLAKKEIRQILSDHALVLLRASQ